MIGTSCTLSGLHFSDDISMCNIPVLLLLPWQVQLSQLLVANHGKQIFRAASEGMHKVVLDCMRWIPIRELPQYSEALACTLRAV